LMNQLEHNSDIGKYRKNPHKLLSFFMLLDLRDFLLARSICLPDIL